MRFTTRTVRAAAIAAASVGLVATSALSAQADNIPNPDADDIVIVGSDTTQLVLEDLSNLHNSDNPTEPRRLANFLATGTPNITIRPGVTIPRPNGSSAGINALCSTPQIDTARSSRVSQASDCANLGFLQFAEDQLRWAGNDDITGVTSLTDAQLTLIYNCDPGARNWSAFGGPTIVPLLPQGGSGTRVSWATQVGINPTSPPSCVQDQVGGVPVQEHDPSLIASTSGALAPFSTGRWNLLTPAQQAGAFLGQIPAPDSDAYDRPMNQVVRLVDGAVPDHLAEIFGDGLGGTPSGDVPYFCIPSDSDPGTVTPGDVIKANGFVELGAGVCGTFSDQT
jgi:type II secretory pathway pseudopilin PulG